MPTPALLHVADRLASIVMALVDAISRIALDGSTPTFSDHAAQTLFFRLARLVATLIRIANFGIRARATPAAPKARTQPTPIAQRSGPAQRLPRHPGWLLAALPDIAPAVAADLAALLADPALTALLAATPALIRPLRPLLRGLGLPDPPSNPPPRPDPSRGVGCSTPHQSNNSTPIAEPTLPLAPSRNPRSRLKSPDSQTTFHAQIITVSQQYMPHFVIASRLRRGDPSAQAARAALNHRVASR